MTGVAGSVLEWHVLLLRGRQRHDVVVAGATELRALRPQESLVPGVGAMAGRALTPGRGRMDHGQP